VCDTELGELLDRVLHDLPVAVTAHYDAHERRLLGLRHDAPFEDFPDF